jgi:methylated-DNA-[protein]-cysteine S-methyltransferase
MRFHSDISYKFMDSPWGQLTLAASPKGLYGIWFEGQKHYPNTQDWESAPQNSHLLTASVLLKAYFEGQWPQGQSARDRLKTLPLDLSAGTEFQQAVWQALMSIPMGQTCSYGQLASAIGRPSAVRAVGTAIGRNRFSILIPCHRVLGGQGEMTGYAGGIWRKQALLQLENAMSPSNSVIAHS